MCVHVIVLLQLSRLRDPRLSTGKCAEHRSFNFLGYSTASDKLAAGLPGRW